VGNVEDVARENENFGTPPGLRKRRLLVFEIESPLFYTYSYNTEEICTRELRSRRRRIL
jgi:hypothetical protein